MVYYTRNRYDDNLGRHTYLEKIIACIMRIKGSNQSKPTNSVHDIPLIKSTQLAYLYEHFVCEEFIMVVSF